jgi:hypothetical protein
MKDSHRSSSLAAQESQSSKVAGSDQAKREMLVAGFSFSELPTTRALSQTMVSK